MTEQNGNLRPLRERTVLSLAFGLALLLLLARVMVQRRELSTVATTVRELHAQNRFALAERTLTMTQPDRFGRTPGSIDFGFR